MRRDYGWTKALLTSLLAVGAMGLSVRVLLTGLFVTFVTSEVLFVVLFNLSVTALVGRLLLSSITLHPRDRRQRGMRNGQSRPTQRRTLHRSTHQSKTGIDRL
ncbi:hypothetical protein [Haladaptatus caseinilyticus]|uniref:hypothetical protein n=1 Tax=Haladaptatus caseinilyticus TaxID=2993314 RepID=UPI00224A8A65|nr:hypothetical protein [Haladaptatus caseinilyticus]